MPDRERPPVFIRAGDALINVTAIRRADCSEIEDFRLTVVHDDGVAVLTGIQAIDAVMAIKPSALEGRRFRWVRHAWAFHNVVAHPLMQVLAFCGFHDLALHVHDATAPRPAGRSRSRR